MSGLFNNKLAKFAGHVTGFNRTNQIVGNALGLHDDEADAVAPAPAPTPAASALPKVPPMPTPDDAQVKLAKRRSVARQSSRSGRVSTIFTDPNTATGLGG